ncbi:TonB-dependent receptor family protein [Alteromonas sp. ASW11-130]|uniref:TonB-dependent receptor family protein n=1 Tax=Alteromonas sp. ASW11-130 TaxID=3015775 RepID=UPI0022423E6A|nr:TonB-dependent receptor [Alteromonas sp. ASW11-130]MCW8093186.1 TonB-dependent receptor [Alteromonas sp. ASW11-130]
MTYISKLAILMVTATISSLSFSNSRLLNNSDIEHITTTQQRYQFIGTDAANSTATVSEASLLSIAPIHIEEALRQIAGIGIQRGSGQEYLPALRSPVLTGAGACGAVLTSEDSIPIRAAGFCNNNELFEAHTEMAQRIDVIKGPATVVYGSNALHGVINVVSPDTTEDSAWLGVDVGSFGYKRLKGRYGLDNGSTGLGANVSITRDNGFRDEESVFQEKMNLRHRYNTDNFSVHTGLTYIHLDQQTAGYLSGEDSYKSDLLINFNENPEAYRWAKALRVWSKFEWQKNNAQRISITPYFRNQDMQFVMHFLPGKPIEINGQQGGGVQSSWQYWKDGLSVIVGADAEFTEGNLKQFQEGPTKGSAFLRETIPAGEHYNYQVDALMLASFAQVSQQWGRWTLSAGTRYEAMTYDYRTLLLPGRTKENGEKCGFGGCRYSRPSDKRVDFNRFSPKLGVTYAVSNELSIFASLADGYRIPQASELFRLQREQTVAELSPETGLHREVGAHFNSPTLSLKAAYYLLAKQNVIYRDDDFFNVSNGETEHEGIELSVRWQLHPQWSLSSAMTYAEHTYIGQAESSDASIIGNEMDTAPRTIANSQITWEPATPLEITLEWQHIGKYFTDAENAHTYSGHDVLHLSSHYQLNPHTTLRFRVYNLFDTRYAERADFTSFTGARYFPGQPRHFLISAEYSW